MKARRRAPCGAAGSSGGKRGPTLRADPQRADDARAPGGSAYSRGPSTSGHCNAEPRQAATAGRRQGQAPRSDDLGACVRLMNIVNESSSRSGTESLPGMSTVRPARDRPEATPLDRDSPVMLERREPADRGFRLGAAPFRRDGRPRYRSRAWLEVRARPLSRPNPLAVCSSPVSIRPARNGKRSECCVCFDPEISPAVGSRQRRRKSQARLNASGRNAMRRWSTG